MPEPNIQQRFRYDLQVTEIPKAPLWFLVVVCLIYIVLSIIVMTTAMILRRNKQIAANHAKLLPRYPIEARTLVRNFWGALVDGELGRKGKHKKRGERMKQEGEELDRDGRNSLISMEDG